jgi:SAM-dependent methyltransferase
MDGAVPADAIAPLSDELLEPTDAPIGGDGGREPGRDGPEFRAHWQRELTARAAEHWTERRLSELARGKALLLPPVEAAPLLRTIGLLHRDASMPPRQVRKYWQVSHMVTLLGASLRALLAAHGPVRILDAGCGRSYLSLALAWVAEHRWGGRVQILGVDRNAEVIAECRRRARFSQLEHALRFADVELGQLDLPAAWRAAFPENEAPLAAATAAPLHALISLHACDTATCDALALAVRLGAELIAVAPCCQAELARGWSRLDGADATGAFRAVWSMPHLRRETGADLTDAMRALLLRACGYSVSAIEFVPSEHTRKNTLLKAVARPAGAFSAEAHAAHADYRALVAATGGVGLGLAERLPLPS